MHNLDPHWQWIVFVAKIHNREYKVYEYFQWEPSSNDLELFLFNDTLLGVRRKFLNKLSHLEVLFKLLRKVIYFLLISIRLQHSLAVGFHHYAFDNFVVFFVLSFLADLRLTLGIFLGALHLLMFLGLHLLKDHFLDFADWKVRVLRGWWVIVFRRVVESARKSYLVYSSGAAIWFSLLVYNSPSWFSKTIWI